MWNTRPYTLDSARVALLDISTDIFALKGLGVGKGASSKKTIKTNSYGTEAVMVGMEDIRAVVDMCLIHGQS